MACPVTWSTGAGSFGGRGGGGGLDFGSGGGPDGKGGSVSVGTTLWPLADDAAGIAAEGLDAALPGSSVAARGMRTKFPCVGGIGEATSGNSAGRYGVAAVAGASGALGQGLTGATRGAGRSVTLL